MARQVNIRRPAGYLRATLLRSEIDPVQDGKVVVEEADAKTFLGEYADYYDTGLEKNDQESSDE
jgi:hypothetical protein